MTVIQIIDANYILESNTDLPMNGIPFQLLDHLTVLEQAAKSGKYPVNNWLEKEGKGCDHKSMYASIFRHVAEAYSSKKVDDQSGLDPRLHAACRLMMDYTRDRLGLNI